MENFCDKILTNAESSDFERDYFARSQKSEFEVISNVGKKIANALFEEFGAILKNEPKVLALIGKGHNGADAASCVQAILSQKPNAKISLFLCAKMEDLKPNTRELVQRILALNGSVKCVLNVSGDYDLVLDGIAGMGLRYPLGANLAGHIDFANKISARIKAAIDLPSGLCDEDVLPATPVFKADVTYMTGIAKASLFKPENFKYSGRLRYVDLDFFKDCQCKAKSELSLVTNRVFEPLKKLRNFDSDKRSYGHLFIFGGSANYAGAVLMNVKAALRAGVGLVSAFVPESIAHNLAAAEPACIWVPCPENSFGGLALESFSEFKRYTGAESAILAGSGLGASKEAISLISEIAKNCSVPMVLDADAIRNDVILSVGKHRALITPHMGEFKRVAKDGETLADFCKRTNLATLLKAPISRVCDGGEIACLASGGPMLSRAGSGDVLAGIAAALLARKDLNFTLFESAACASQLLGQSSQKAFAKCGENAFANSEIFNFIKDVLND